MLVTNLFVKRAHGENLEPVESFDFDERGIVNGVLVAVSVLRFESCFRTIDPYLLPQPS